MELLNLQNIEYEHEYDPVYGDMIVIDYDQWNNYYNLINIYEMDETDETEEEKTNAAIIIQSWWFGIHNIL